MELASHLDTPIMRLMEETDSDEVLLWYKFLEQKKKEEWTLRQRQDYLFARVCLEIAKLRHVLSSKKRRRFRGKLEDFLVDFKIKDDQGKSKRSTSKRAPGKQSIAEQKFTWFRGLGIPFEELKYERNGQHGSKAIRRR